MTLAALDRRAALKARHRAAILAAARELVDERGPSGFTTDDLAARADVSRRTVFNHFAHLEDVVVACVEAELESAIAAVEADLGSAATAPAGSTPLDDLEATLTTPAVATALSRLGRALSAPGHEAAAERVRQQAMHRFGAGAAQRLAQRHPGVTALELDLLTSTVMNGMAVVATAWLAETSGALDDTSRRRLADLLDVLFTAVRHGFGRPVTAAPRSTSPSSSDSTEGT